MYDSYRYDTIRTIEKVRYVRSVVLVPFLEYGIPSAWNAQILSPIEIVRICTNRILRKRLGCYVRSMLRAPIVYTLPHERCNPYWDWYLVKTSACNNNTYYCACIVSCIITTRMHLPWKGTYVTLTCTYVYVYARDITYIVNTSTFNFWRGTPHVSYIKSKYHAYFRNKQYACYVCDIHLHFTYVIP